MQVYLYAGKRLNVYNPTKITAVWLNGLAVPAEYRRKRFSTNWCQHSIKVREENCWKPKSSLKLGVILLQNTKENVSITKEKNTFTKNAMEGLANRKNLAHLWSHQNRQRRLQWTKNISGQNIKKKNFFCLSDRWALLFCHFFFLV